MAVCPNCKNTIIDPDGRYCSKCGSPLEIKTASAATTETKKKKFRVLLLLVPLQIGIAVGAFFLVGGGCSSVSGSLVSTGKPLGNFTFTPAQCRSGQRMQFFGAVLLGKGPTEGAVVAMIDQVKGKLVKVEIPGSCKPPDFEVCEEVIIDTRQCSRYDVIVNRTSVMVNDIVMVEGRVSLDCAFPGGGSVKGELTFERCN